MLGQRVSLPQLGTDLGALLVGMQNGTAAVETVWQALRKLNTELPRDTVLSESSESPEDKSYMVPLIQGTQTSQIHRGKKVQQRLPDRAEEKWGVAVQWVQSLSFARRESSGDRLHNNMNVHNTTDLYA